MLSSFDFYRGVVVTAIEACAVVWHRAIIATPREVLHFRLKIERNEGNVGGRQGILRKSNIFIRKLHVHKGFWGAPRPVRTVQTCAVGRLEKILQEIYIYEKGNKSMENNGQIVD